MPTQPTDSNTRRVRGSGTPSRAGFTLIEMLVVVCIIALLISILLPAISSAREAARRTQCKNNLMQLGIALHNYEDAFTRLPPGCVNDTGPIKTEEAGYHMSWIVQILPQIEQKNAFLKVDFRKSVYDATNDLLRGVTPPILQCPSDPSPWRSKSSSGADIALNSYAGCHNDAESPIDTTNNGVLFLNSSLRWEDIPDGLSTTIVVGEKFSGTAELGWASGTRGTLRNAGSPINRELVVPAKSLLGPAVLTEVGGFGSSHVGGCHFVLGDGAVRFISENINFEKYRFLANRDDGEIIGDF